MNYKITHVTRLFPTFGGGKHRFINVCDGGASATVTARYGAVSYNNIITLAHYPMTCVLYRL